jgi:hypothetical protein
VGVIFPKCPHVGRDRRIVERAHPLQTNKYQSLALHPFAADFGSNVAQAMATQKGE